MRRIIHCECGQVIRAESDDKLISAVQAHVKSDHPDLVGKLSEQDILAMSEEDE